jgi:RNA-directed DNA polymerase
MRYADDMVALARTGEEAHTAWDRLEDQCAKLHLAINHEKSRLGTVDEGFAFLGFEFRRKRGRLYLWPRSKSQKTIMERVRKKVRSFRSSGCVASISVAGDMPRSGGTTAISMYDVACTKW